MYYKVVLNRNSQLHPCGLPASLTNQIVYPLDTEVFPLPGFGAFTAFTELADAIAFRDSISPKNPDGSLKQVDYTLDIYSCYGVLSSDTVATYQYTDSVGKTFSVLTPLSELPVGTVLLDCFLLLSPM